MDEQTLQDRISALPRDHEPRSFTVYLSDKKGRSTSTRYVLASSKRRAELTGLKVALFVFSERKAVNATAVLTRPDAYS